MNRIIVVLIAAFSITACSENTPPTEEETKESLIENIEQTKVQLNEAGKRNKPSHAERLVTLYTDYANQYPQDSLAPEMLFMAGNVCIGLEEFDRSISYFERIDEHYKTYLKHPEAIYLSGFVADYHQNKKGVAKDYYEKVIELYPNHVFAKDAKQAIMALNMSDEELLRMFEEKNKPTVQE